MSAAKLRRQTEIVRRCVLGGESQVSLCREFGISSQQFFADRRDGIRRALALLAQDSHEPASALVRSLDAGSTRIAQATALHEAGISLRAADILERLPERERAGVQSLEALALELDVDDDIGRNRHGLQLERWRRRRDCVEYADETESHVAEAGIAWIESRVADGAGDRPRYRAAVLRTTAALRRCARDDARHALTLARFLVAAVPSLVDFGESALARDAIAEAARVIVAHDDAPVALRAMLHANRAFVYSAEPANLARASTEGATALALARTNALPRTTWVCLYLRIFENIWRDDVDAALDDAIELVTSVEAGDSRPWRRIARSRLSNALSARGLVADAALAIEPYRDAGDPLFALQTCALAFREKRYDDALAQAATMARTFADATPAYRANMLLYSAASAHRLRDLTRAAAEISDAVALFESAPAPNLFIAQRAYVLGHTITGRARYRDAARDLQNAFDAAHGLSVVRVSRGGLTRRQNEIASLAAAGATNRAIAVRLGISARTVGNHLAAVFEALGIRARWQLDDALRRTRANDAAS